MKLRNPFAKNLVGIDVGSRTVKGVSLKRKRNGLALDKFFFYDLSETARAYPDGANPAEALRAGVSLQALEKHPFAAGVPDRDVIHLELRLPRLAPAEMRTAVMHELSELTGIPAEQLAFDFLVHADEKPNEDPGETLAVSAYGSRRQQVESLVKLVASAALVPRRVESDTIAIAAALEFNGYIEKDRNYAVLDLGERHVTASLLQRGEVRLSKSFEKGWGSLNEILNQKFGQTYAEAESHKRRYDFNAQAGSDPQIEQAIDEAYAALFSQVKQALELFADYAPEEKLDRILLVGGASQTPNLPRVLEMFFKVPVEAANPFRRIEIYDADDSASDKIGHIAPFLMAAVGLALSNEEDAA